MDEKGKLLEALELIIKKSQDSLENLFFLSSDGKYIMREFEDIYNNLLTSYNALNEKDDVQVKEESSFFKPASNLEEIEPSDANLEKVEVELPTISSTSDTSAQDFKPAGDLEETVLSVQTEEPNTNIDLKVELPEAVSKSDGLAQDSVFFEPAGDLDNITVEEPNADIDLKVELPEVVSKSDGLPQDSTSFKTAGDLESITSEEPKKDVKFDLPVVDLSQSSSLFEPAGDLDNVSTATQEDSSKTILPVVDTDDFTFHITKDAISQDLPINKQVDQNFVTPSMTEEQIKTSQELIDAVPSAPEKDMVDSIAEEINRMYADYDSHKGTDDYKPMTDEEVKESQEKINSEPVNNKLSWKKILKKGQYDWKDSFKKRVVKLRGILYKESMRNHTQNYMKICQMIANFRVNYHNISITDADKGLETIDRVISESGDLSFEEKKRLYRKLTRLVKAVERVNAQKEKKSNAAPSVGM